MNYKALKQQKWNAGGYLLTPIRKEDILEIKNWRNKQMNVLRQKKPLTDEDQISYYDHIIIPSFSNEKPKQILFSFLFNNECIGYGGLVHIDWNKKKAELSFLVNPERTKDDLLYRKEFSIFIEMVKEIAFTGLNLQEIFTETYDIRPNHIKILEDKGFKLQKRMKNYVKIDNKCVGSLVHGYLKKD